MEPKKIICMNQWVYVPPDNFFSSRCNRSSHGGSEVAEASGVEGKNKLNSLCPDRPELAEHSQWVGVLCF